MDRLAVILHVAFCVTVLVAPTCSSSSWARNVLYRPKRQDECQPNQFTCTSGACVDTTSVCNGTAECRDLSDETEDACKQKYTTPQPEAREGCVLPQQPEFGSYTSPACENGKTTCRQVPGTPVPELWLLTFKCNDGYYMNGTSEDKILLFCNNGKWSAKLPVCLPLVEQTSTSSSLARNECQPNQFTCTSGACINTTSICNGITECRDGSDETENVCKQKHITQKGCILPQQPEFGSYTSPACENGTTTCKQVPGTPVPQYSLLTFKCNDGYYTNGTFDDKVLLLCVNGKWSETIPVCRPICGRINSEQRTTPLNVTGSSAAEPLPPWVAMIYTNFTGDRQYHWYSGTLISPHTVLTTAHCVDGYSRESLHKVRVAVGKRYTDIGRDEPGAMKVEVRDIAIHPRYSGRNTHFAYDVALIDLNTSLPINSYTMPACVDWGRDLVLTTGQLGMTVHPRKNGTISTIQVAYKDSELCRDELVPAFRNRLIPDKWCLEPIDSKVEIFGFDGVMFERNGVHYVKCVMSTVYPSSDGQKLLQLATNLGDKDVLEWLQRTKRSFDEVHNGT